MRKFAVLGVVVVAAISSACVNGQAPAELGQVSAAVSSITIWGDPAGSQQISQPSGTSLSVNRLEEVRYADNFAMGSSDLGAKVNAAIDDLPAGGGIVEIPAGNWTQTTTIVMGNRVATSEGVACASGAKFYRQIWLRGQGLGTRINYTGGGVAIQLGDSSYTGCPTSKTQRLRVTDLGLEACPSGGSCSTPASTGILVRRGAMYSVVERVRLGVREPAFDAGFQTHIQWGEPKGESYCTTCTAYGGLIRQVEINNAPNHVGIDLKYGANATTVADSVITGYNSNNNATGIVVTDSSQVRIEGNDIEWNSVAAIVLGASGGGVHSTTIARNYFEPTRATGYDVIVGPSAEKTTIDGNYTNGCYYYFNGGCQGKSNYSIRIAETSQSVTVTNNRFRYFTYAAILNTSTSGSGHVISGNHMDAPIPILDGETGVAFFDESLTKISSFGNALRLANAGSIPACGSATRGTMWFDKGTSVDHLKLCMLVSSSPTTYEWRIVY